MYSPSKSTALLCTNLLRAAVSAAVACSAAAVLTGCEKSASSADIRDANDTGAGLVRGGVSNEAVPVLEPISKKSAASGATLQIKYTLGHAKLDLARAKAAELDTTYLDISRLQGEIAQISTAISVGNTLVDGYRKQNPAEVRALIKQRITEAQGGPDKGVWMDTGKQPIPTIAASKQKISTLEQQVAAKKDEIQKLNDQRSAALQAADKLRETTDALKGREAVDAYAKASEGRKNVSLISSKIETAEGELAILQRDQEIAQGQLDTVSKYVDVLQQHDKALATGFQGITDQIAAQLAVSNAAASAPAANDVAASIAAKAGQLSTKMADAAKLHDEAETLFKASIDAYESAFAEATKYRGDLSSQLGNYTGKSSGESSEEAAIKTLQNAVWPSVYRIQEGIAIAGLGDLYARKASVQSMENALVAAVTPVLKKAEIAVPAALTADAAAAKASVESAAENYTKALAELEGAADNIQGSDPEKRRQAAAVARVFILNAWADLLAQSGNAAGAKAKIEDAKKIRDDVMQNSDGKFPAALPPALAVAAATPPSDAAPAATEPTTKP